MPVSAAALALSAAANAAAEEAHVTACESRMQVYTSASASAAQRLDYAACVGTLYSGGTDRSQAWVVLLAAAAAVAGGAFGWWREREIIAGVAFAGVAALLTVCAAGGVQAFAWAFRVIAG